MSSSGGSGFALLKQFQLVSQRPGPVKEPESDGSKSPTKAKGSVPVSPPKKPLPPTPTEAIGNAKPEEEGEILLVKPRTQTVKANPRPQRPPLSNVTAPTNATPEPAETVKCKTCNKELRAAAKFCTGCGSSTETAPAPAAETEAKPSPKVGGATSASPPSKQKAVTVSKSAGKKLLADRALGLPLAAATKGDQPAAKGHRRTLSDSDSPPLHLPPLPPEATGGVQRPKRSPKTQHGVDRDEMDSPKKQEPPKQEPTKPPPKESPRQQQASQQQPTPQPSATTTAEAAAPSRAAKPMPSRAATMSKVQGKKMMANQMRMPDFAGAAVEAEARKQEVSPRKTPNVLETPSPVAVVVLDDDVRASRRSQMRLAHVGQEETLQVGRASVRGSGRKASATQPPLLSGVLWKKKQGKSLDRIGQWKKRFFRQSGAALYWFEAESDSQPLSRLNLRDIYEVSKRYHKTMGPCIGVLVGQDRLVLLAPGKLSSTTAVQSIMRYWFEGLSDWQQWLDSHPEATLRDDYEGVPLRERSDTANKTKNLVSKTTNMTKKLVSGWGDTLGGAVTAVLSAATEPEQSVPSRKDTSRQDAQISPRRAVPNDNAGAIPRSATREKLVLSSDDAGPVIEPRKRQQDLDVPTSLRGLFGSRSAKSEPELGYTSDNSLIDSANNSLVEEPFPSYTAPVVYQDPRKAEQEARERSQVAAQTNELDLSLLGLVHVSPDLTMGLRRLRSVDLSFNLLSQWPEEALLHVASSLEVCVLAGCQLTDIPASLGRLTALQELTLNGNAFRSLPREVGLLQRLEKLNVANNQLAGLPETMGWMHSLEELHVSGNAALTRLPDTLGNLRKLQVLDASFCGLNAIPDEMVYCTQLMDLNLMNNALIRLPTRMGWWVRVVSLNVAGNKLRDIPLSAGLCEGLGVQGLGLNLQYNPIDDRDMMKTWTTGADRLAEYLERRMILQDFDQRSVMRGYPQAWPFVPLPPLTGAVEPGKEKRAKPVTTYQSPLRQYRAAREAAEAEAAAARAPPQPAAPAGPDVNKLNMVRSGVETIFHEVMAQIFEVRSDLLSPTVDMAVMNKHSRLLKSWKPDMAELIALGSFVVDSGAPAFQASDDKEKRFRLTLLAQVKLFNTVLDLTRNLAQTTQDPKVLQEIVRLTRQIKVSASAALE